MGRYFTLEDLRRAGGRAVLLEEGVLVTPQALAAAREAGIELRTPAGPYAEPAPDRGPEAARTAIHLPHMPEPVDDELHSATGVVLTAVGKNRPGVLAEITACLARHGVNVHNISQKMVEDFFHLVLVLEVPPGTAYSDVKREVECLGGEDDYVVRLMHERVFRFMHRI
jgi:ACT domain-containing protein